MSEIIEKLIKESTYHFMGDKNLDPDVFTDVLIEEIMKAIDNTNTWHVRTSYDHGLVKETIIQTKKAVLNHFKDSHGNT